MNTEEVLKKWNDIQLTCTQFKPKTVGDWFLYDNPISLTYALDSTTFMVKTVGELITQYHAIEKCKELGGKVLTTGLGLGIFIDHVLVNENVESITVVEKYQDVIDLVAKPLKDRWGDRLIIIKADALEYVPDQHYTVIWHDIWAYQFAPENKADCEKVKDVYEPFCDWQGFWQTHG